jgi:hypothetical protein
MEAFDIQHEGELEPCVKPEISGNTQRKESKKRNGVVKD